MDSPQQLPEDDDFVPQLVSLDDIFGSDEAAPSIAATTETADDYTVRLPAHGSTVSAEDLKVRLVLAADLSGEMAVDASAVESIGQSVLQLLVAARREAQAIGKNFRIENPSPAFVDRVTRCRLADAIGIQSGEDK